MTNKTNQKGISEELQTKHERQNILIVDRGFVCLWRKEFQNMQRRQS